MLICTVNLKSGHLAFPLSCIYLSLDSCPEECLLASQNQCSTEHGLGDAALFSRAPLSPHGLVRSLKFTLTSATVRLASWDEPAGGERVY